MRKQIIGAPSFFPTVWGWIKKWFDPITTSKIFIIAQSDVKKTLEAFIDPVNIPKKYGGQLDFEFGHQPSLDPHLKSVLQWEGNRTEFPEGPMYWEPIGDGKIKAIARGTLAGGKERHEEVCVVTRTLPEEPVVKQAGSSQPIRPDLISAPTETEVLTTTTGEAAAPVATSELTPQKDVPAPVTTSELTPHKDAPAPETDATEVDAGKIVPPSRPEPQSFVTAHESLPQVGDMNLSEKVPEVTVAGDHHTRAGALLDPATKN
jgi:hypothetical protein